MDGEKSVLNIELFGLEERLNGVDGGFICKKCEYQNTQWYLCQVVVGCSDE